MYHRFSALVHLFFIIRGKVEPFQYIYVWYMQSDILSGSTRQIQSWLTSRRSVSVWTRRHHRNPQRRRHKSEINPFHFVFIHSFLCVCQHCVLFPFDFQTSSLLLLNDDSDSEVN